MFNGFDSSVIFAHGRNLQSVAKDGYRLVMEGIDWNFSLSENVREESVVRKYRRIDGLVLPLVLIMKNGARKVLGKLSSKKYVYELHPLANTKNGFAHFRGGFHETKQEFVIPLRTFVRSVQCFSVDGRVDVRSAGKHEGVKIPKVRFDIAYIARNDPWNCPGFLEHFDIFESRTVDAVDRFLPISGKDSNLSHWNDLKRLILGIGNFVPCQLGIGAVRDYRFQLGSPAFSWKFQNLEAFSPQDFHD